MFRNLARAVALVAATLSLARAGETGVAARVNGVAIEAERLQRYFEDYLAEKGRNVAAIRSPTVYHQLHREALDELIAAELLWQEARRKKIAVASAEIDAAVADVRAGFKKPGSFERRLERGGFTEESYRAYVEKQLAIRKLVQREVVARVSVSDAEVHAYYEANPDRFVRPPPEGGAVPEREAREAIRQTLHAEKARETLARKIQALRERGSVEIVAAR
jgi:peptidyl-prolyl cis-trans isomerase C